MKACLNFHTHRPSVSPSEIVIRDLSGDWTGKWNEAVSDEEWFSVGIHPWYIPECYEQALEKLAGYCRSSRCVALGEAGLDKCTGTSLELQKDVFIRQLAVAGECGLPVVVHCVRAWGELLEVHKEQHPPVACVVHGFRGGPALARQLLDKGFYLSFGFHFNERSLAYCPSDRFFLETDEDRRSVEELYRTAALIRGCEKEDLVLRCWENLRLISSKNM